MSCSCTTCIVYVISSKNASSVIALLTKADAKVRTLFYIIQINPKLFFKSLLLVVSLAKGRTKGKETWAPASSRKKEGDLFNRRLVPESGCKGKDFTG